ncbi:protein of unknown function DUF898 transmembrane [Anaeromyxobacter dehalogenans 2CP-1]|uniref:DUF898 domain-containing protein n=1 Tax=Anaeromyxobacter dehalogenans (strain ATCC BAA-258 / DSM 21875 / 2CP-1) TaxID=455488 RepID=B8J6P0_ANAD2|nr:YjgN family protein [Anaeromyxobacter dehalogenans]ACL67012.1 protein of unknown function DUF898 transmembrane [Anaeromyxobacter dehalogenans 2CP-1]
MTEFAASMPAAPADAFPTGSAPRPQPLPIRFTGSGGEYFRIWIVNLLLTLVTLGVWSAWAKVRKTRYFWSNTQVAGAAFQYHGNPGAILRGRLLAGAVFLAYSVAGRISVAAGLVAGVVLVLLGPWLFHASMRFKLANTSWRGLRFGFDSTAGRAYAVFAPGMVLGVLFIGALATIQRIAPGEQANPLPFVVAEFALFAFWPWLHARLKAYQHGRAQYGNLAFEFEPSTRAFYGVYGKAFLFTLPFLLLLGIVIGGIGLAARGGNDPGTMTRALVPIMVATYAVLGLSYAVVGAIFTARLQRLVWTRTHAGPVRFATSITARGLMRVWIVNGVLTLLTLGVYWPWAAVAIARYRLECMTLEAGAPLETIAAGRLATEGSATGEGAVDLFGWDIGL